MQRRRDRINEKMKALQELIPRCNKVGCLASLWFSVECFFLSNVQTYVEFPIDFQTDKASMLDEAIEYLKTLQLQVQVHALSSSLGI